MNELGRNAISSLIDDVYKLFKDHPGCEEWTNKLLADLKNPGKIADVLESFRQTGRVFTDGRAIGTGGGVTGIGRGFPSIDLTYGSTKQHTAVSLMHEILHWAGINAKPNGGFTDNYTDAVMATAWNMMGVVMSVEQYRHTYPEQVAMDTKRWGYDFAESRLASGANDITCLGIVNGYLPKYAKP